MTDATALLVRETGSFVQRLRLWTPARYAAAGPRLGSRGDVVHHLGQAFADQAAWVEGGVRRLLPRLDSDLGLADQLAVTADDLVRAHPDRAVAVAAAAHLLLHRWELLDDAVPAGLAASLRLDDVQAHGRTVCERDDPAPPPDAPPARK